MPLYEYECEGCRYNFEAIQKFSDPVLTKCPSCDKMSLRKLISKPAVRVAGEHVKSTLNEATKDTPLGRADSFWERYEQVQKHNEAVDRGEK